MFYKITENLKSGTVNTFYFDSEMEYKSYISLSKQYAPYEGYKHLQGAFYQVEYIPENRKEK